MSPRTSITMITSLLSLGVKSPAPRKPSAILDDLAS
jgi:hypothetical protein